MKSAVAMLLFCSSTITLSGQSGNQGFSVKDDIAMSRFSIPSELQSDEGAKVVEYSPNGEYVAIVTTRGLLDSDEVQSTISIISLTDAAKFIQGVSRQQPKTHTLAVVAARPRQVRISAYASVIDDLKWSSDSTRIYFRAENSLGALQVDEVRVGGGPIRPLTPERYSVDRFDVANGVLVFTAYRIDDPPPPQGVVINRDAFDITGYRIKNILFPGQTPGQTSKTLKMGIVHLHGAGISVRWVGGYSFPDSTAFSLFFPFHLSSDGSQLMSVMPVVEVPKSWGAYKPSPLLPFLHWDGHDPTITSPENALRPRQYALMDVRSGRFTPVFNAPNARNLGYAFDANEVVWAEDGRRVLITNTFFPPKPGDAPASVLPCVVASVDLPSHETRCVVSRAENSLPGIPTVTAVRFSSDNDEIVVSTMSDTKQEMNSKFRLENSAWKSISEPNGDADGRLDTDFGHKGIRNTSHVNVYIKEDLNIRPTLWGTDPTTGISRQLWDANPQLQNTRFGEVSVYRWKDKTGTDWVGGLVKPVGYESGKRYPLVIQMYQFFENDFLTDGTDPSAFAARHLASAGFVVLQIRKKPAALSEAELQTHLEGYKSAIEGLSKAGLIDPARVGVVGFSATVRYALNAIEKEPGLFAAATIADGIDYSYMAYLIAGPGVGLVSEQNEKVRGSNPFGEGLQNWVRDAPGFHTDRIQTPLRMETMNPASVLYEWEIYSSLFMQHKPVDLIYFPESEHIHQRPLERLESQQGNVDWMRFWLQGYEDPDQSKVNEYRLWEHLRAARDAEASRNKPQN